MPANPDRNEKWNHNHEKIEIAFWQIYAETGLIPKVREISDITGLTPKTIYDHYYDMPVEEITEKYKVHLDRAMGALCKKAEEGDVNAIQLLAKLTGWTEKKKTELEIKNKTVEVKFTD